MYNARRNGPPPSRDDTHVPSGYDWQSDFSGGVEAARNRAARSASRYDSGPYQGYSKRGQYSSSPPPQYSRPPRSRWSDEDDYGPNAHIHGAPASHPHSRYPSGSRDYGEYHGIDPNYHNRRPPRYTASQRPSAYDQPSLLDRSQQPSQAEMDDIRDDIVTSVASEAGLSEQQTLVFRYFGATAAEQAKFTLDDMVESGLMDDQTADMLEHVSQQKDGIWPAVDLLHEYLASTWLGQDNELVSAMLAEVDERTAEVALPMREPRGRLFAHKSKASPSADAPWMSNAQSHERDTSASKSTMPDTSMRDSPSIDRSAMTSTPDQLDLQNLGKPEPKPQRPGMPQRTQDSRPSITPSQSHAESIPQPAITSNARDTTQLQQPKPKRPPQPSVADADADDSVESQMHATTASDHYGTTRPGDRPDMSLEERLQSTMAGMKETQDRWDEIDRVRNLVRAADWDMMVGEGNPARTDPSSRFHFVPSELDQDTLDRIKPPPAWKARQGAAQFNLKVNASVEDGVTYDIDDFTQSVASTLDMSEQQSKIFKAYAKSQTPEERNAIGSFLLQTVRKDKEHVAEDLSRVFASQEILSAAERYMSSFQEDAAEVARLVRTSGMEPAVMEEFSKEQLSRALAIAHRSEAGTEESYAPYFQLNFEDVDFGDTAKTRDAFESMASDEDSRFSGFAGTS